MIFFPQDLSVLGSERVPSTQNITPGSNRYPKYFSNSLRNFFQRLIRSRDAQEQNWGTFSIVITTKGCNQVKSSLTQCSTRLTINFSKNVHRSWQINFGQPAARRPWCFCHGSRARVQNRLDFRRRWKVSRNGRLFHAHWHSWCAGHSR